MDSRRSGSASIGAKGVFQRQFANAFTHLTAYRQASSRGNTIDASTKLLVFNHYSINT